MPADPRQELQEILGAALRAGDAGKAVRRALVATPAGIECQGRRFTLRGEIRLLGVGKAAVAMVGGAASRLGSRVADCLCVIPHGYPACSAVACETAHAGHPLPDPATLRATARVVARIENAGDGEMILLVLSGGASALLEEPAPGLTLKELRDTSALLFAAGADIQATNAVRKHLSAVKGGRLALRAAPRTLLCLALSDVPGDEPAVIGSGPAVADPTTYRDALAALQQHDLLEAIPKRVRRHLCAGADGHRPETPFPGDPRLGVSTTMVIGNKEILLDGAEDAARRLGYEVRRLQDPVRGEARAVGRALARRGLALRARRPGRALCLLSAGETTVEVRGSGVGGRNQELALAAATVLDGTPGIWLCSAASDGIDGPTPAAGALVDGTTLARARELGLDADAALADNDSHGFFERLGDRVLTGPTGTNLMDVQILLIRSDDGPR